MEVFKDYWVDSAGEVEFVASGIEPNGLPVTAVKIFIFDIENKLLLVKNKKGWDIPGGHVEDGESPLDALQREVIEETGSSLLNSYLVGYLKITNTKPNTNKNSYPKVSCILMYKGSISKKQTQLTHEVTRIKYFSYKELSKNLPNWNSFTQNIVKFMINQKIIDRAYD